MTRHHDTLWLVIWIALLAMFLTWAATSHAQEPASQFVQDHGAAYKVFHSRHTYNLAAIALSGYFDTRHVQNCIQAHTCVESNSLYGLRPSFAHQYSLMLSIDAAEYGMAHLVGRMFKKDDIGKHSDWIANEAVTGYIVANHVAGAR